MELQSFHCKHVNKMVTPRDCVKRQKAQANKFCFGGTCQKGQEAKKAVALAEAGQSATKALAQVAVIAVPPAPPTDAPPAPPAPTEKPPRRISPAGRVSCDECGSCGRHRKDCSKYGSRAKNGPLLTRPVDPKKLTDEELVACGKEARERATRLAVELEARVKLLRGES